VEGPESEFAGFESAGDPAQVAGGKSEEKQASKPVCTSEKQM
jgi:hypothetical protein